MNKILFDQVPLLDSVLKETPYSYQYDPRTGKFSYEIISYGFEDLIPECLIRRLEGYNPIQQMSSRYQKGPLIVVKNPDRKFYEVLNVYETSGILKTVYHSEGPSCVVTEVVALDRVRSFQKFYPMFLILYVLANLGYDFHHSLGENFLKKVYLRSSETDLSLNLSGSALKYYEDLYLRYLPPQKVQEYLQRGFFEVPSHLCYSTLRESLIYYLESFTRVPNVPTGDPFVVPLRTFYSILSCLDIPFWSFNHLTTEGLDLDNPIGSKCLAFCSNPILKKKIPPEGYTLIGSNIYIWNLRSKLKLRYLKKAILQMGIDILNQQLKKTHKLNILDHRGKILELRKGFIVVLRT